MDAHAFRLTVQWKESELRLNDNNMREVGSSLERQRLQPLSVAIVN